jgi:putative mRNA 3-end processing factor
MAKTALLRLSDSGLYCEAGGFYVDPWQPVDRAIVTHAHGDHLRAGSRAYLISQPGEPIFRARLPEDAVVETVPYGHTVDINGVKVSLHPAGHILGSSQIRIEFRGEVWVVSGDYKRDPDPTCAPFEPVRCHTFITEATFGLPIYRWPDQTDVFESINQWWRANREAGKNSILFAYALGKSQRVLASVDASIGPIYTHGSVERLNQAYRAAGIALPLTTNVMDIGRLEKIGALVIAPLSARGTPWMRRLGTHSSAFISGWMRIRGTRRRRAVDRGFVLSDHVDWPALMNTIQETGASRILVTHGYTNVVARWLREQGMDADVLQTHYNGELEEADPNEDQP